MLLGNMWLNSFKNACEKNAIFNKVTDCRTYATSLKISSSRLFLKDFSPDFTTNSLERATSGKPTSPERLQWLFVPLLLFLLSHLIFTCPKLAQKYWRNLFYSAFFQWYCADFEQNNRYLKNVVGQFFPKQQLQKMYRIIF